MNSPASSYLYKFFERILTHAATFIVSLILARILSPSDYGTLSIIIVFVALAQVFIEGGLSSALIQNKDVKDGDYNTILTITLLLSLFFYIVIFTFAPGFENWLQMPGLGNAFRIIALVLFPSSFLSVIKARLVREMRFKIQMVMTLGCALCSGLIGIFFAYNGFGVWSLIIQQLSNTTMLVLFFSIFLRWIPKVTIRVNWSRAKELYNYGWKIMCTNLLVRAHNELISLAIGKQFSGAALGAYDRGKQFPQVAAENFESSIQSVSFSLLSKDQQNIELVRSRVSNLQVISSYIIFFILSIIGSASPTYIPLLLTEKWIACIPFLMMWAVCYVPDLYTVISTTAINSVGLTKYTLQMQLLTIIPNFIVVIIVVMLSETPLNVMIAKVALIPYNFIVTACYVRRAIGYKIYDQISDLLPNLLLASIVAVVLYLLNNWDINRILLLVIQGGIAVIIYTILSSIFKVKGYANILQLIKSVKR